VSLKTNNTNQRIRQIVKLIDLTDLGDDCDQSAIEKLCTQAITPVGPVAAICIWPKFVKYAKQHPETSSNINIATVINFPAGSESPDLSTVQIEKAIVDGATEIDYVMPYRQLLSENISAVEIALKSIRRCVPDGLHLKVILETGELKTDEMIRLASALAIDQGADFIKTSTGKVETNATPDAARIMLEEIVKKNVDVGFKPAGGIRTVQDAETYLTLAKEILGNSWVHAGQYLCHQQIPRHNPATLVKRHHKTIK